MKLQLLPVFVLPLVSGFASVPATETECFFMYSADPSLVYSLAFGFGVTPPFPDLVGKVWEGVELTIQGPETVMPETVTGQASCWIPAGTAGQPNSTCLPGIAVMSKEFCLPHGNYTISLTTSTATNRTERTTNDCTLEAAFGLKDSYMFSPEWAVFPASLRDEAVAALQALFDAMNTSDTPAILAGVGWAASKGDSRVQISTVGDCYGRNLIVPSTFYNDRNVDVLAAEANLTCVPDYGITSQGGRRRHLADECA